MSIIRKFKSQFAREKALPKKSASDVYLTWLRFAVPGMLADGNVAAIEHAVREMPAGKSVVEIGSFCGLSTSVICYFMEKRNDVGKLFTADKWEFEGQRLGALLGDSKSVTHDKYKAYVKSTFLRTMETFGGSVKPHTIECFSDEFFGLWFSKAKVQDVFGRDVQLGGEISFAYIDGNHTYDFARRDFENVDKALVRNGFILFDDSSDRSHWEVNRLTRALANDSRYKLISKNPNYLFQKL